MSNLHHKILGNYSNTRRGATKQYIVTVNLTKKNLNVHLKNINI